MTTAWSAFAARYSPPPSLQLEVTFCLPTPHTPRPPRLGESLTRSKERVRIAGATFRTLGVQGRALGDSTKQVTDV